MNSNQVDSEYIADAHAFATLGAGIMVWSLDEPEKKAKPATGFVSHAHSPVVWRGWMLSSLQYEQWVTALKELPPLYSLAQYEMHHRMRCWVPLVQHCTPATWFIEGIQDIKPHMFPCHVKDGVKSANATNLPRPCHNNNDVHLHEKELKRQRGTLDDGLVLRQHVDAYPEETRVWMFGKTVLDIIHQPKPGSPSVEPLWILQLLANAPQEFFVSPFTIDIARSKEGTLFVMGMGDAGVSDYKTDMDPLVLSMLHVRWYATMQNHIAARTTINEHTHSM